MSILGDLGGMVGGFVEKHGGAEAMAQQALGQVGGLQGMVDKLRQAGYGEQVQSWLGAGPNQPVTADGVAQAIGHGKLGDMAQHYGVEPEQLSGMLAHVLPGLIDRLSPAGAVEPHLGQHAQAPGSPLDPAS